MKSATVKDDYINKEDAVLLNKFLDKIKSDLKNIKLKINNFEKYHSYTRLQRLEILK